MSKTRTLSIGLLKRGHASRAAVVGALREWSMHPVTVRGECIGQLFVRPARAFPPGWASLFASADDDPVSGSLQKLTSAVLVVDHEERTFVLPFGHSRHAIPDEALEERFGRVVTLNSLDAERVRQVDNIRLDGIGKNRRTQIARPSSLGAFDLDATMDVVCAVAGEAKQGDALRRVSGGVYFQPTTQVELATLREALGAYRARFEDESTASRYGFLEKLTCVRNAQAIDRLDEKVRAWLFSDAPPEGVIAWMVVPELVDWEGFEGFRITAGAHVVDVPEDLHVRHLRRAFSRRAPSFVRLKRARVEMLRNTGATSRWPAHRCLYAEVSEGTCTHILADGKWYAVDRDLMIEVTEAIAAIPKHALHLPEWKPDGREDAFNEALVDANPSSVLGDKKLVDYGGAHDKVEVFDMYGPARELVHVKKYKSSADLSHLFQQGVVSATLLLEEKFRQKAAARIPDACLTPPTWQASEHPVTYLVGTPSRSATPQLPLFSKLTLRDAARRLRAMGYPVQFGFVRMKGDGGA